MKFFDRLKAGLAKTRDAFMGKIDKLFQAFVRIDEDFFDELEELLISADLGVGCTEEILDNNLVSVANGYGVVVIHKLISAVCVDVSI